MESTLTKIKFVDEEGGFEFELKVENGFLYVNGDLIEFDTPDKGSIFAEFLNDSKYLGQKIASTLANFDLENYGDFDVIGAPKLFDVIIIRLMKGEIVYNEYIIENNMLKIESIGKQLQMESLNDTKIAEIHA